MDDNYNYSINIDQNFTEPKFRILSKDGFEIVSGSLTTDKIYLSKKDLIDDYILILESNEGGNAQLNLKLNSVEKVIKMNVPNSLDYSFIGPYQNQVVEFNIDQAGLYFFDFTYSDGVWWTFEGKNNNEGSNNNGGEAARNLNQVYESASNQTTSYYLNKGIHRLILRSEWNVESAIRIHAEAANDIVELDQIGSDWVIPRLQLIV